MHGKDTFSEFREFINTMESRVQELGKVHGVEHLAGPQGFAVKYLSDNQDKEIFIKDIEKRLCISKSVASNLVKRMEKNGVVFCNGAKVQKVKDNSVIYEYNGEQKAVEAEVVLMAVGRVANTDGLNTEGIGIEFEKKAIEHSVKLTLNMLARLA